MNDKLVRKPIYFDDEVWALLQKQADKYKTTPSKALDFILNRYYKLK